MIENGIPGYIHLDRDIYIEVNIPGGLKSIFYRFIKDGHATKWKEVPIEIAFKENDGSDLKEGNSGAYFKAVDKHGHECDHMYFISEISPDKLTDGEEELHKYE